MTSAGLQSGKSLFSSFITHGAYRNQTPALFGLGKVYLVSWVPAATGPLQREPADCWTGLLPTCELQPCHRMSVFQDSSLWVFYWAVFIKIRQHCQSTVWVPARGIIALHYFTTVSVELKTSLLQRLLPSWCKWQRLRRRFPIFPAPVAAIPARSRDRPPLTQGGLRLF